VSLRRVRQLQRQYQARPDYASPPGPMNRYRIAEHLAKAFSTTLGQLVGEIKICSPRMNSRRSTSPSPKRNFLAHHFWFERVHLMSSADGCRALIAELNAAEKLFNETDNLVDMVAAPYLAKTGLSPDVLAEAMRGEPMEPLRSRVSKTSAISPA
jgi:hypothetical protein